MTFGPQPTSFLSLSHSLLLMKTIPRVLILVSAVKKEGVGPSSPRFQSRATFSTCEEQAASFSHLPLSHAAETLFQARKSS